MKKAKYIIVLFIILLMSGCADIELPPEQTNCSWYINDTYTNSNWLYYDLKDMIDLNKNPSLNFWYNNTSDYGFNFTGLKDNVTIETYDKIVSDALYEITLCDDSSNCVRLSFSFDSDNIKQSQGTSTCNYPTLYYEAGDSTEAIRTYYFSTGNSNTENAYINIFNTKENNPDSDVQIEENWCSSYYVIKDNMFNNNANLILYFWNKEDHLYYAIDKIDSNVSLNDETLKTYSKFNANYNWQLVNDNLTYYDSINSTTFTLVEFNNMGNLISYDNNNKLICPDGYIQNSTSNATTGEYDGDKVSLISGERFKKLLGALKLPLSYLSLEALNIPLTINGNENATLNNDVEANNLLCFGDDCKLNAKYFTEQGLKNVKQYCNELYSNYDKYKNDPDNLKKRMDECIGFNNFYDELVNRGIVENFSNYCGILSQDFASKLKYFLNIIKVAGPLLALGLGTVDFVKVLANGDADKEMKNAFKRFLTRLGAAALLFLVPIILAFLLDLFIKPDLGYDPDNPFCDIVDWNN